jgi:hypothetical protein
MADTAESSGYAKDHIYDVVSAFANYIFKYTDYLLAKTDVAGVSYMTYILRLCEQLLSKDFKPDNLCAAKILSCVFEGC